MADYSRAGAEPATAKATHGSRGVGRTGGSNPPTGATTIGEWKQVTAMRPCGSSIAHETCKLAGDGMECAASKWAYNDCPYRQRGIQIAAYD